MPNPDDILKHTKKNVLSKHETLTQCLFDVGPVSSTVGQRQISIEPTSYQHLVNGLCFLYNRASTILIMIQSSDG